MEQSGDSSKLARTRSQELEHLEQTIQSPIGPEWGWALFRLNPSWGELDRWMSLSKEHCLAAVDALLDYAKQKRLPEGSTPALIDAALTRVLEAFGNWRLKEAAKELRYIWPNGKRPRHPVSIPQQLELVADVLSRDSPKLKQYWLRGLASGRDPVTDRYEAWSRLLDAAERRGQVVTVDHRAAPDNYVPDLAKLPRVQGLPIDWSGYEQQSDVSTERLLATIGSDLAGHAVYLVSLDNGSDCYPLTVMNWETAQAVKNALRSVFVGDTAEVLGVEMK